MNAAMSKSEIGATGRRKTASARVRICQGSGKIKVNGENFDKYFNVSMNFTLVAKTSFSALHLGNFVNKNNKVTAINTKIRYL